MHSYLKITKVVLSVADLDSFHLFFFPELDIENISMIR